MFPLIPTSVKLVVATFVSLMLWLELQLFHLILLAFLSWWLLFYLLKHSMIDHQLLHIQYKFTLCRALSACRLSIKLALASLTTGRLDDSLFAWDGGGGRSPLLTRGGAGTLPPLLTGGGRGRVGTLARGREGAPQLCRGGGGGACPLQCPSP